MSDRYQPGRRRERAGGFTLVELLVVILIILLVSAVTLPVVVPALASRQVSEGARILQAGLAGARDTAIRNNAPRGIRLLPDPTCSALGSVPGSNNALYYNRYIPIEPAADLNDDAIGNGGSATFLPNGAVSTQWTWTNAGGNPPRFPFPLFAGGFQQGSTYNSSNNYYPLPPLVTTPSGPAALVVVQATYNQNMPTNGPNPPTSWFWNVRIGDRIRFNESGYSYTIVGPMTLANPDLYVNDTNVSVLNNTNGVTSSLQVTYYDGGGNAYQTYPEYLILVDGLDAAGYSTDPNYTSTILAADGYVDNGFNGFNENLNSYTDELGEWFFTTQNGVVVTEVESFQGNDAKFATTPISVADLVNGGAVNVMQTKPWTISRRPVPSANGQETNLPAGAVIDATTWNSYGSSYSGERSRLPIDPNSYFVDIMLNPSGQVIPTTTYSTPASASMAQAFYHFWVCDRSDIYEPNTGAKPYLPIPAPPSVDPSTGNSINGGALGYSGVTTSLKKDRQLVTLFARNGALVTNSIENFDYGDAYGLAVGPNAGSYDQTQPFDYAQFGIREAK